MAIEFATGYITILPSLKGAGKSISSQLGSMNMKPAGAKLGAQLGAGINASVKSNVKADALSPLSKALPIIGEQIKAVGGKWQSAGKRISGVGGSLTKKITAPVGIAATAIGGLTAALGWGRLTGLDSAKAQLEGLGYSTEEVGTITGQVTKAIDGGMTTMAEGTAVAAGALAAGVDEGKDLKDYITRVGNAAVGANRPVSEMAQIFNRVQGSGKLMTQELNMVEQGMPGFAAAMAKSLGVPQDEFRKMVTEGKVSSEDFMDVMDDFAGGMAEAQANSWDGLVKNALAYVGIIGEALLGGVFGDAKTAIADFQEYLKSDDIQAWAADMGAKIGDTFGKIVTAVRGAITWWSQLNPTVKSAITGFAGFLVVAGPIALVVGKIVTGIGGLISAFGTIVSVVGAAIPVIKALNVVMRANVFGIVVTLIAALVAGLIYFFTQTEIGQEIWGGFVNFLKDVWENFSTFLIESWSNITTFISEALANIGAFFTGFGASVSEIWTNLWTGIGDFLLGFWEGVKALIGAGIDFIKMLFFNFTPLGIVISNFGPILAFVTGLFANIRAGISVALGVIRGVISSVTSSISSTWSSVWNGIKAVASAVWSGIVAFVTAYINTVRAVITSVVRAISSVWSSTWNGIKSVVVSIFGAIRSFISGAMSAIRSVVVSLVNGVRSAWTAGWNAVKSAFVSVVTGIVSAVSSFVSSVKSKFGDVLSFASSIPGKLVGFFSGMGSRLIASGKALIGGLKDGIMAGFERAKGAVKDGLAKIRNFFPFSPAKEGPFSGRGWVAYSGVAIGETFSDSVADSLKDGRNGISDELGGIQDEFDDFDNQGFRVGTSIPDFEPGGAAGGPGGALGEGGPLIHIENMTVDSDTRVKQIGQDLYARASRANRARGAVQMGGATV